MNCQDIADFLDERGPEALSRAERPALAAHLAGCPDCAAQWRAAESLQSFRSDTPPLPAALSERAWQLQELRQPPDRAGRSRRPVLIGSLLLLGAAATMFASAPWSDASAAER